MKFIYGLSKSGYSIIKYLDKINEKYICWDDNKDIRKKIINKKNKLSFQNTKNLNFKMINEGYISPGISLSYKKLDILRKNKVKLYRDLEFYSKLLDNKEKIIAITGTNGKSTTTKLIGDIIKFNKIRAFVGGNIGLPLLDFKNMRKNAIYHVLELSSFQLESAPSFKPFISILLNISPDHLDRYKDMKKYAIQKEKIISLNQNSFNIISVDDKFCRKIYNKYKNINVIPISELPIKKGIYFKKNQIIDNFFYNEKKIKINNLSKYLEGSVNIQNILAAYAVTKILRLKKNNFLYILKNYIGLSHRYEKIFSNKKLNIINNSKATNVSSAVKSLNNLDNIFLILGGRAKEKNFKEFLKYKKQIVKIYLVGESSRMIFKQLNNSFKIDICKDLDNAIKKFKKDLLHYKYNSNLIFSPACSSFDQYANYEERGNHFKKLIKNYIK